MFLVCAAIKRVVAAPPSRGDWPAATGPHLPLVAPPRTPLS